MIELSLSKLVLIGIVALIVIGPDKLPNVARKAGILFARSQRWMDSIRSDIGRDINLDGLRDIGQTVREAAQEIQRGFPAGSRNESPTAVISPPVAACSHAARARRFRMRKREKAPPSVRRNSSKYVMAARHSLY